MKPSPLWHPFTQHGIFPTLPSVTHAEGAHLFLEDGTALLDGISSWWVITHGHSHPKISAAIAQQAARLDQVIFADFSHEPAQKLAEKLVDLTPPPLQYVFFSDSGSTSVEVALKMALGYWHHKGHTRTRILALEGGYHGDTFGAMALGASSVYHAPYAPFLFPVEFLACPDFSNGDFVLETLKTTLKQHHEEIACFILEPLVLGAGGMKMYPKDVLREMVLLCQRHDILVIFDEVMTGWGRTGSLFALDHLPNICPDLLCLSKGITGGSLPLATTLATEEIFRAFYSTDRTKTFFHSSSYTANPIACHAARANLKIWEEEPVFERLLKIEKFHKKALAKLSQMPKIKNTRSLGTIAAFEVEDHKAGYFSSIGLSIKEKCLRCGVFLRPLGNTVYILPPYCITEESLEKIYHAIEESILHPLERFIFRSDR